MSRSISEILSIAIAGAWRRRYLIAIPILVMPVLGAIAGRIAPKAYESRMTILVQEPDRTNPILNDLAIGSDLKDRMPALLALLKSKRVLLDVLRDLGQVAPDTDSNAEDIRVATLGAALNAELIGSDLIELKIRGQKAVGLARILDAVGGRLIDSVVSPGRGAVDSSESFLEKQLEESNAQLVKAENADAEFKTHNADKLPALYTANVAHLSQMLQRLDEKRIELAVASASLEDLRTRASTLNPVVDRLEEAIVQASTGLVSLRARYAEEHPEVQAARRKLHRLEEDRAGALASNVHENGADGQPLSTTTAGISTNGDKRNAAMLAGQMTQIQEAETKQIGLRTEAEQLTKGVEELRTSIAQFGPIEEQQQQLERAVASARETHDMLAKRYEMARLTSSLGRFEAPERIKIIDAAQDPIAPVTPGGILFILGGLIGGMALGAGLATVFEVLDPRLRRIKDFEEAAGLQVIAFVPPANAS